MLVSILINNYNYEAYLGEAIASALGQTYNAIEVVVVDDGSTDGSRQIIEEFCARDDRIVSVFKENGGQASAMNAGIAASHGELICLLDADDCFYPSKVARIVELFEADRDFGWIFHSLQEVDRDGNPTGRSGHESFATQEKVDFRAALRAGEPVTRWLTASSGLCFRREIFEQTGEIPEAFRVSADSFVRLAALYLAPGLLLPDALATHRKHGENLYEFRQDIAVERVKLGLRTAFYLQERFAAMRPFARRQFTFCLSRLIEYANVKALLDIPEAKLYLAREKSMRFRARALAYAVRGAIGRIDSPERKKLKGE